MKITTNDLKLLLIETFKLQYTPDQMPDDMKIIGEGLCLDSIDALEIIAQVEFKFGIKINPDNIKPEYFMAIDQLTNFINSEYQLTHA